MSLNVVSSFNGVTDPDAGAYIAAVEAADGQLLEFAVGKAINDFVVGCKADGIWNAIKASCILAGARKKEGAFIDLKTGTQILTNNGFTDGDYNRKTGILAGGGKSLNSNRNNNADPQNSKHMALNGSFSASPGTAIFFAGQITYFATGWSAFFLDNRTPSGFQPWINGVSYPSGMVALSSQSGFFGASRSSNSSVNARIGAASYTSLANSQPPANENLSFCISGSTNFYSIGESLDLAKLDSRVTDLINAFGAAIP